jgi:hypothetical protein
LEGILSAIESGLGAVEGRFESVNISEEIGVGIVNEEGDMDRVDNKTNEVCCVLIIVHRGTEEEE